MKLIINKNSSTAKARGVNFTDLIASTGLKALKKPNTAI